jgi:isopentenyl-diphosphate delta-isomerase type 1
MGKVVLVNEKDEEIGVEEKIKAHREGKLHRAFSIFIFNKKGELLIQKRTKSKYHSGRLWSNTCCSHPRPKEGLMRRQKEG